MSKRYPAGLLASAALSFILALGTGTVFQACPRKEDGTWMHCHGTQNCIIAVGVVMGVLLLAAAFWQNRNVRLALAAAAAAGCAVVFLLPGTLHSMCMMATMRCHALMQPFAKIMSVLILVILAVQIVLLCKKQPAH